MNKYIFINIILFSLSVIYSSEITNEQLDNDDIFKEQEDRFTPDAEEVTKKNAYLFF